MLTESPALQRDCSNWDNSFLRMVHYFVQKIHANETVCASDVTLVLCAIRFYDAQNATTVSQLCGS